MKVYQGVKKVLKRAIYTCKLDFMLLYYIVKFPYR